MGSEKRPKLKECKWKGWMQQHLDEEQVIACNWEAFNLPAVSSSHRHSWNSSRHRQCIWIQTVWKSVLLKEKVKWKQIMCRHMFWVSMCLLFSEWNLAVTFLSSSAFLFLLRYLGPSSGDQMHLEFKSQLISLSHWCLGASLCPPVTLTSGPTTQSLLTPLQGLSISHRNKKISTGKFFSSSRFQW